MKITDDYSFVSESNQTLINRGLADLSVHSLNFDRYFTDEEMEHNRKEAERLNTNSEAYSKRCEEISRNIYNQLLPIAELLDKNFNMYQYTTEKSTMIHFNSDWDLFFYSNRGWNGKDYFDYIQISFNEKRTAKQNQELLKKVLTLLTAVKANNIKCRIQYDVIYHENEIAKEAASVFEKMGNRFIAYDGMIGKIKKVDDAYGFFKKGSKKHYYPIGNACMLTLET